LIFGLAVAMLCSAVATADDDQSDPASAAYRDRLHARLDAEIAGFTEQIAKMPERGELYSRRGDRLFFRGKFEAAVADFEKMVALQPDLETSHWRRGIAYFYAKRYKDAARQFEIYHSFDNVDRENGIWRYLSQVKAVGKEEARKGLLKYQKDDREPFPDVYRLFAGELTGDEVLGRIARANITAEEREPRLFYAELYVGLNDYFDAKPESAEKHLTEAVRNRWGEKAGGGPGWMWHVGRVHLDTLRESRENAAPPVP
jgi:lipoprotein NlpI